MACGVEEVPQVSFVFDLVLGVTGSGVGREAGKPSLISELGNNTSLMRREIRLGTSHVLASQKCMVQSSCIPVIFRAGLIAHLLG